jgi:tetratricopeptide (TPR) repeat protein
VSPTRRRLLAVLGAVTGIALAAVTLHTRERRYPLPQTTDRLLYLRSGAAAGRLALSFDALAADIYWIRTIQHYGRDYKNRGRASRFELLQPLLDLTTTLDKHFLIAYRFGAIFLAQSPPDGPGRPDQAIALLEKGLKANPDKWQLPYEIAFTHYLYTGDFDAAVVWFRKAAALPGAPEWIAPLAALTADKGGNRAGARQMLRELQASQEEYIRRSAERSLLQLDALDAVDQLQDLVRQYRERTGRPAPGWSDLVSAGLLRAVPRDQFKVAFVLDPATGTVRIAPDSPLMPLPPMLRK